MSAWLKVSRRTLQDYRSNGMIAYYQLGGKILYKESDIEKMVMSGYRNAYRLETWFDTCKNRVSRWLQDNSLAIGLLFMVSSFRFILTCASGMGIG